MKKTITVSVLYFLLIFSIANIQGAEKGLYPIDRNGWLVANLLRGKSIEIKIKGSPKLVSSPYGEAVYFNGVSDALFLEEMPLKSLREFTVEMIFCPDTLAPFEQRILHIGEINDDRMLLEIRAVNNSWYLDGFVASSANKKTLINEQLTHPLGQWSHVAFVVSENRLTTFVNGKQELSEPFSFVPIESGRCSIGVRQNEQSWFKGMIYKIKITPKQITPDDFMAY